MNGLAIDVLPANGEAFASLTSDSYAFYLWSKLVNRSNVSGFETVVGWPDEFELLAGRIVFIAPAENHQRRRTAHNRIRWKSSRGWKPLRSTAFSSPIQVQYRSRSDDAFKYRMYSFEVDAEEREQSFVLLHVTDDRSASAWPYPQQYVNEEDACDATESSKIKLVMCSSPSGSSSSSKVPAAIAAPATALPSAVAVAEPARPVFVLAATPQLIPLAWPTHSFAPATAAPAAAIVPSVAPHGLRKLQMPDDEPGARAMDASSAVPTLNNSASLSMAESPNVDSMFCRDMGSGAMSSSAVATAMFADETVSPFTTAKSLFSPDLNSARMVLSPESAVKFDTDMLPSSAALSPDTKVVWSTPEAAASHWLSEQWVMTQLSTAWS